MEKIIVTAGNEDLCRIDKYLAGNTPLSREYIKKLIGDERIKVNNMLVKSSYAVKEGDKIVINVPSPRDLKLEPMETRLDIVYEDKDLLVINKRAGMVVHAGVGGVHEKDSLVNAVLYHCKGELSGIGGVKRPGIVHRLDKDTSGLIIVAKNDKAHESLSGQFKERTVGKTYIALVAGIVKHARGKIIAPIGRDLSDRKKMALTREDSGKEAISRYEVVRQYDDLALVKVRIHSGRTHQIRVHMSSIGHPVAGDGVYGNLKVNSALERQCGLKRQFLHAAELEFTHPVSGKRINLTSNLPEDLAAVLECIDKNGN